jgi:hypothetical protein
MALSVAEGIAIAGTGATFLLALAAFLSLWQGRKLGEATRDHAAATAHQAAATADQAEATAREAEAATRSLELQLEPRLVPLGGERVRVGEQEDIGGQVQQFPVLPVYLDIANAGNGVAAIETVDAEASGLGRARALFPPTILAGQTATIELYFPFVPEGVHAGDKIRANVVYYSVADNEPRRTIFDAEFLGNGRWENALIEPRPRRG